MPNQNDGQRYRDDAEKLIAKAGWAVQVVQGTLEKPHSYAFTIGLHSHGLPELIVFGLCEMAAIELLNSMPSLLLIRRASEQPLLGAFSHPRWEESAFFLLKAKKEHIEAHANFALERSEGAAEFLQIVYANEAGFFPWQFEALKAIPFRASQPIIGVCVPHC